MKTEIELLKYLISGNVLTAVPNFYIENDWDKTFECDLFVITKSLITIEYEIKMTKADYLKDFEKRTTLSKKHDLIENGERTNRFYFVLERDIDVVVPKYAGLIEFKVYDGYIRFEKKKDAPLLHKNKAEDKLIRRCANKLLWRYYAEITKPNELEEVKDEAKDN